MNHLPEIQPTSYLTAIIAIILFLMVLFIFAYYIIRIGIRNVKSEMFDLRYKQLQMYCEFCIDYNWKKGVDSAFDEIMKFPEANSPGNKEKLQTLYQNTFSKFAEQEFITKN